MKKIILVALMGIAGWGCLSENRATTAEQPGDTTAVVTAEDCLSGVTYTVQDSIMVCRVLAEAKKAQIPTEQLTLFFARKFLGVPYVAHTLEVNDEDQLVVNTRQLDCMTLVETVVALTLCAKEGKCSFTDYADKVRTLRYRGGQLDGYTSRLHYFSDWIMDNEQLGLVQEISMPDPPFSAVQKLSVNYMSRHPQAYKALKAHPEWVSTISQQEQALTGRTCPYIPKSRMQNNDVMRRAVHDGDILALTTTMAGLEISHLGFAVWREDGLHLLNASMIYKKVVEDDQLLRDYLQKRKSATGVRVIQVK